MKKDDIMYRSVFGKTKKQFRRCRRVLHMQIYAGLLYYEHSSPLLQRVQLAILSNTLPFTRRQGRIHPRIMCANNTCACMSEKERKPSFICITCIIQRAHIIHSIDHKRCVCHKQQRKNLQTAACHNTYSCIISISPTHLQRRLDAWYLYPSPLNGCVEGSSSAAQVVLG